MEAAKYRAKLAERLSQAETQAQTQATGGGLDVTAAADALRQWDHVASRLGVEMRAPVRRHSTF